jgi:hypothetical protein
MSDKTEDDEDWKLFPTNSLAFQDQAAVDQRLKRERKANRTKGERKRRAKPKKHRTEQVNVRMTKEMKTVVDALALHLGCNVTDMIERAVMEMAKREKLNVGQGGKGSG